MMTIKGLIEKIEKEGNYYLGKHRGYLYIIRRPQEYWWLCWYVLVPKTNKLYWKHYDEIDWIEIHWWLTFSWKWGIWSFKITDQYWILWFDAAHSNDVYLLKVGNHYEVFWDIIEWTYKDMEYMKQECKKLINQIIKYDLKFKKNRRWTKRK